MTVCKMRLRWCDRQCRSGALHSGHVETSQQATQEGQEEESQPRPQAQLRPEL